MLSCSQIVHATLAPDFTLVDIDGNTFSLVDFRGKVVILEFFSTTCSVCKDEIPHLKVVEDEFGQRLVIISLALWANSDATLRQFRDYYNIAWIVANDAANVHQNYNASHVPTLYVIDREGYIRYQHIGETAASVLEEEVSELLPVSLTVTTSPSLDDIQFRVDGNDYYTLGGNINVELEIGLHQVELVDSVVNKSDNIEYRFSHWGGIGSGSNNSIQIDIMTSSVLEANFDTYYENFDTYYEVVFNQSGSEVPPHVTVDEVHYTLPQTFLFKSGSLHNFSFESPVSEEEVQYVLTSKSHTSPIAVTEPMTVTGFYETQYYITVISAYNLLVPSQWVTGGDSFTANVTSPTENDEGTRYRCIGFKIDDGQLIEDTSCTLTSVQASHKIEFQWVPQYDRTSSASTAPSFNLIDIDDVEFSLRNYKGKVILLNFFATSCSFCRAEMSNLKVLQEEFAEDIVIISLSIDPYSDTIETLKEFRQENEIAWTIARDTEDVSGNYNVTSVPTIVIISREGYIIDHHAGSTDESILHEEILTVIHQTAESEPPPSWLTFVLVAAGVLAFVCMYVCMQRYEGIDRVEAHATITNMDLRDHYALFQKASASFRAGARVKI